MLPGSFSLLGRQADFFGAQFLPEGSSEILTTKNMGIDDDFAQTIGFEFIEGKGYSKETNDSLSIILNESAVKTMGFNDPIGKKINQIQRWTKRQCNGILYDHRRDQRF